MNQHELAAAHRALLQSFVDELRRAEAEHRAENNRLLLDNPGEGVDVPPVKIRRMSPDVFDLITQGIDAALAGNSDPFGLIPPRGKKPKLTRKEKIDVAQFIAQQVKAGTKKEGAIADAKAKFGIGRTTITSECDTEEVNEAAVIRELEERMIRQLSGID